MEIKDNLDEMFSREKEEPTPLKGIDPKIQIDGGPSKESQKELPADLQELFAFVRRAAHNQAPHFWEWLQQQVASQILPATRGDIAKLAFLNGAMFGCQITLSHGGMDEDSQDSKKPEEESQKS